MKSFLSLLSERMEMRDSEKCRPGIWCRIKPRSSRTDGIKSSHCYKDVDVEWCIGSTHDSGVREDLGSILTQTQDGILTEKLSSPLFQATDLKTISFSCNIAMSS